MQYQDDMTGSDYCHLKERKNVMSKTFDKEGFKERVKENVKTLYRKTIDEATQQQLFQAVCVCSKGSNH